jgi:hypothetical protein
MLIDIGNLFWGSALVRSTVFLHVLRAQDTTATAPYGDGQTPKSIMPEVPSTSPLHKCFFHFFLGGKVLS